MKICVFSESSADEKAIQELVNSVLGESTVFTTAPAIRGRGRSGVFQSLGAVIKALHFNSDEDALVVVVDSDEDTLHKPEHEEEGSRDPNCTLCRFREEIARTQKTLPRRWNGNVLKIAAGVAVPAIEAWYLFGTSSDVGEATWTMKVNAGRSGHVKRQFKKLVYGTERPTLKVETERAIEEAKRISEKLDQLETSFPQGFGALARTIRSWRDDNTPLTS